MGRKLAERYELNQNRIEVLSNAAFFGPTTESMPVTSDAKTPICIGFLGNITFAKGVVEFFDVLAELYSLAVPYSAYIAGPVAPDARATFDRLLAKTPHVTYRGALYDEDKWKFYRQLNILLFPTKYVNEAEPLVIHEAMQCGVHVIACARGAIPEMLSRGAGLAFDESTFVMSAAAAIRAFHSERGGLALAQRLSYEQAHQLRLDAERRLVELIERIRSGDTYRAQERNLPS
jgi:glycosyltransferase involved in cell wall biosynthesis